MYTFKFYRDSSGDSEVKAWMDGLAAAAGRGDKNARIQLNQLTYVMNRVKADGTRAGEQAVKRLTENIFELRPGDNRVLFFAYVGNEFVLLSYFRKKTQKTPPSEIEKAERLRKDWIDRKKG